MKDRCSQISRLLEKYFDREATTKERSLVEKHLPTCSACSEALRSMGNLRDMIKIPVEEAAQMEDFQWVWQKIKRGIEADEKPAWWEALSPRIDLLSVFRRRVWIPAVAAIVILILVAFPFFLKKISSPSDASVVEYVESPDYNVMVYQSEEGKETVIWLLDGPEQEATPS
jgi:anti-sigma factor RsiW